MSISMSRGEVDCTVIVVSGASVMVVVGPVFAVVVVAYPDTAKVVDAWRP
jgi:hypothetical protein